MSSLKRLMARLVYGGDRQLRSYEEACVKAVEAELPSGAATVLGDQLRAVELVQRSSNDKLVAFFFLDKVVPLLPNRAEELQVARLKVEAGSGVAFRCDLVCHEGRLSSLEFSKPPRRDLSSSYRIAGVEIQEDVLAAAAPRAEPLREGAIIGRLRAVTPLSDLVGPVPAERISALPRRLSATLPEDYATLLRETNGFSVKGWRFLGTNGRRLVLPDANLYVTAENDEEAALCLREGDEQPRVYIYDPINDELAEAGPSWTEAFLSLLSEKASIDAG